MHKRSLEEHKRKIHGIRRVIEGTIKCPGCETKLVNMKDLLHHVTEEHSSAMETYDKTFSSTAEFESWLENEQKEQNCMFTRIRSGKGKVTYLCHRSGCANPIDVLRRKRLLKRTGSCKIGATCAAHILRKEVDGKISIFYCRSHFGHQPELGHLRLLPGEKDTIAGKLSQGIPAERILGELQRKEPHEKIKRIHLINLQDVVNVSKKYGISQSPNKHTTDMLKNGNAITIEKTKILQEADGFPDFEVAYEMVVEATEELPESFIEKRRKEKLKTAAPKWRMHTPLKFGKI